MKCQALNIAEKYEKMAENVLTAQVESDSDDEGSPNWELLSSELSSSALEALQQHMINKPVSANVVSEVEVDGVTPENKVSNLKFKKK
jgi:hypothetical protein